jgi:hypothetical protein
MSAPLILSAAAPLFGPDNAKVTVIQACLYDPQVNRTYAAHAALCGKAMLAARPNWPSRTVRPKRAPVGAERNIEAGRGGAGRGGAGTCSTLH